MVSNHVFNRLLKFNEDVYSQAFVDSIVQKGSNYILKLIVVHTDTEGSEIAKSVWTLFIRAAESDIPRDNKPKKPAKKLEKPKLQPEEPINESLFSIDEDVTYRYSKASMTLILFILMRKLQKKDFQVSLFTTLHYGNDHGRVVRIFVILQGLNRYL